MAADRTLSPNLRLSDFPGWASASEADAEGARRAAVAFLEPIIRRWGPLTITSWLRESGSGAHEDPETVDFVPLEADVGEVHRWAARELAGQYGELLHEMRRPWQSSDHIHRTRWGVGGHGEALREIDIGPPRVWEPVAAFELPPFGDPVSGASWLGLLALAALAILSRRKR